MVDGINYIASQIFSKLDSQDSKGTDNKIEASIWNKFVSDKGGKEISNYIKKENAVKSIISYLTNMSKKVGCTVEELANQWLGGDKTSVDESKYDKSENDLSIRFMDVESLAFPYGVEKYIDQFEQNPKKLEQLKKDCAEVFDDSCKLLLDVANDNYKYKITKDKTIDRMTATLTDGRKIEIELWRSNNTEKFRLSEVTVTDPKKNTKFSMQGFAFFIRKGDEDSQSSSECSVQDGTTKQTQNDILKIAKKIFEDELRNSYGDDFEW